MHGVLLTAQKYQCRHTCTHMRAHTWTGKRCILKALYLKYFQTDTDDSLSRLKDEYINTMKKIKGNVVKSMHSLCLSPSPDQFLFS